MHPTPWNWQQPDWPHFRYTPESLQLAEQRFLQSAWQWQGIVKHLHTPTHETLLIELLSQEAETSFAIEGEHLHRESLQSSLRKHMGLPYQHMKQHPKEYGVAKMMLQLYQDVETPLTHETLFAWHQLVMSERHDIEQVGGIANTQNPCKLYRAIAMPPRCITKPRPPNTCTMKWKGLFNGLTKVAHRERIPCLPWSGQAWLIGTF